MHTLSKSEVIRRLGSNAKQGLNGRQAAERLRQYGKNEFTEKKKKGILLRFLEQFSDFMILVLIAAAVISFLISSLNGEADFTDSIIILAIVILNAILGVIQEEKAEKSLEALKKISAPMAAVIRNGVRSEISASKLVPGDIIEIEAGQYVPADARLLSSVNLKIDESALTGESLPVKKEADRVWKAETLLADRNNMIYSTSIVTGGHGTAVVTATGMATEVGRIADMILNDETPDTPLQKRLASIGKYLGIAALSVCVVIFLLGIVQGREIFDMFMTSVSLAVAAIPEALPGLVTIMLSLGVQRMAAKKAVVKRLPAVETLGSATWICSDKTGTLTQNSMTVVKVCDSTRFLEPAEKEAGRLLMTAALCCNVQAVIEHGREEWNGEATEKALVYALKPFGTTKQKLELSAPRLNEIPFDSSRKCMSTIHSRSGVIFSITKGAPDILLPRCTHYDQGGKVYPITDAIREGIRRRNSQMAKNALRVLAIAYKLHEREITGITGNAQAAAIENGLVFLGLAGMIDPPRKEATECVKICKNAGITPVMITGDHVITACAVAKATGIMESEKEESITGAALDRMSQEQLERNVRKYRVFARVSPEHKVRIVKALQKSGEIVAMTGDGVNDAPALKAADIGCAMGKNGTDVAKNAADMVLMDDNFATIVEAVREGRGIYDNIRKSIHFLLSSNIGEIITIFVAILCRLPSPLAAVQLLWVNLVTDSLPAVALGVEKPEEGIMERKPVPPEKGIFSGGLVMQIILEGAMIGLLSLIAFMLCGSTYAFAVLSYSQLFHAFNMRSSRSLFEIGPFSNSKMTIAFFVCAFMQAAVLSLEPLAAVFQVTSLGLKDWEIILGLSIVPILVSEIQKRIRKM